MRKADANRVTRAAKKLQQAYESLNSIDEFFNITDQREQRDYDFFRSQLRQLAIDLDSWQEQMQRDAE